MLRIPVKYQEPYQKLNQLFNQAGTKIIITDRGLGKSKNAVLWILEQVVLKEGDQAFLMRRYYITPLVVILAKWSLIIVDLLK